MFSFRNLLLAFAGFLVLLGLTKPDLSYFTKPQLNVVNLTPPENKELREKCQIFIDILAKVSKDKSKRLSNLYMDLATLIELDETDSIIKNTEEIRQANNLSLVMLKINMKEESSELLESAQLIIKSQIGEDTVTLDKELRIKSVNLFKSLAWASYEASK